MPLVTAWSTRARHHRTTTERSTSPLVHLLERRLDVAEPDLLGHERVEVEAALQVEVDQHREVAAGQAVAVPAGLQRAAAAEHVDQRDVGDLHVRGGYADQDQRAGEVAGVERLLPGLRAADRLDDDVGAVGAVESRADSLDLLDRVGPPAESMRVGGTHASWPASSFLVVDVDGDDRARAGQRGARDRGVADAAAADDRDATCRG